MKDQVCTLTKHAKALHSLTIKRRELIALINKKNKEIEHTLAKEVSERKKKESQKRINITSKDENVQQKLTSTLVMELLQICSEDDVPRYVEAIGKVLDNFQGGINTIRANSNWLSELISQLTDQMRNFDFGQKKLEAKMDLIVEKVQYSIKLLPLIVPFYGPFASSAR